MCAEGGEIPSAVGPDARPAYWLESSKDGDCWLFFKEGALVGHGCEHL